MVKIFWSSVALLLWHYQKSWAYLTCVPFRRTAELSARLDAHDRRTTDFMCVENQAEA